MVLNVTYNLYEFRMKAGLTQQELADLAGVSKSTISGIENNKIHPTVPTIHLLAYALKIDIRDLINAQFIDK